MDARSWNGADMRDWPSVDDPLSVYAAQRALEAGAQCLRTIRWAQEYQADCFLDVVYTTAREAFGWAAECLACDAKEVPHATR